jgi:hypothetical protein
MRDKKLEHAVFCIPYLGLSVKINKVIYDAENWEQVLNYINTMNIEYTQEQIEWTKRKLWKEYINK